MKWTKTLPRVDDVRVVKKFAWNPVCVYESQDGRHETWVWLRFYYVLQKYKYIGYEYFWGEVKCLEKNPYPNGDLPRGETL